MTAITPTIVKPASGDVVAYPADVELQGGPVMLPPELAGVPLYYRWYSDLHPGTQDAYALDPPRALTDPTAASTRALAVGTHVLTFAVTDQDKETVGAIKAIRHGGVTGGREGSKDSPGAPHPCFVTVLRAVVLAPAARPLALSPATPTIDLEGPLLWDDAEYQKRNRLGYRARFTPDPPDARSTVDLVPLGLKLVGPATDKDKRPDPSRVRWHVPLELLAAGAYALTVRVEDLKNSEAFHECDPVPVLVTA